jgi:hypothetical protein
MNDLKLIFDRAQEKPFSIVVGDAVSGYFSGTEKTNTNYLMGDVNRTSTELGSVLESRKSDSLLIIRGLLQSYEFPKRVDYRLIKTFGGDNYIYFFGEEVPVLRLQIEFTDGTIWAPSNPNDIKSSNWQASRDYYDTINILSHMSDPNSLFYGKKTEGATAKTAVVNVMASFIFNRTVFVGYILDVDTIGSMNKKGMLSTTMSVIIKKYYVTNIVNPVAVKWDATPSSRENRINDFFKVQKDLQTPIPDVLGIFENQFNAINMKEVV